MDWLFVEQSKIFFAKLFLQFLIDLNIYLNAIQLRNPDQNSRSKIPYR